LSERYRQKESEKKKKKGKKEKGKKWRDRWSKNIETLG
jgi:hypothetical protein